MKVVEWDKKGNIGKILIDILKVDPKFSFNKKKEDIFFLYNNEDLYGYAVLSLGNIAELKKIFILPKLRNNGYGTFFLKHIINWLTNRNFDSLIVTNHKKMNNFLEKNSLILATNNEKIVDYKNVLGGNAIEFVGENLPFYITYDEKTNSIREATELEKLSRGQLVLEENQVIINNQIITYDLNFQKVVDGKVVNKTNKELIENGIISLEKLKEKKREELKNSRDEFIKSDLKIDGYLIQVRNSEDRDKFNRIILGLLLGKLKKDNTEEWRLADNTYRAFTYEKLSEVPEIYSDRERNAFKKFHKLDDKLNACKLVEELEDIKWD